MNDPKDTMQSILNESRELWEWSTTKSIAVEMRDESGEAFAKGEDEKAKWLRDCADVLDYRARSMRLQYDGLKDKRSTWEQLYEDLRANGGWQ
jgi:hypothetical protein